MFTKEDVADYYNTTLIHYKQWWNLEHNLSLHYGIWDKDVNTFSESLIRTNRTMMELAEIQNNEFILEAGCGVGGAAIYLAEERNASVQGITLSQKQSQYATAQAKERGMKGLVQFHVMDYTNTLFADEQFDVVWACESISSAPDKSLFLKEAYRVLKKGGRLILSDFFKKSKDQYDPKQLMKKWGATWGISSFEAKDDFLEKLDQSGFSQLEVHDFTQAIHPSAKRMYIAGMLGAIPTEIYNFTHPNVSRFAKTHYKCGIYQYKALKAELWQYLIFKGVKR